ncbi:MAG: bifunctional dTDP-4-dehydrorhamnose 3,5-epimerase family protein/NAD(P)-dependent oxidoreductase [Propionibacteriaceae bacterium]|jgi:dTDP-4-dehydrorhamnose 3,5-epimerase|nr:bifunctional dTDP-4-dehydrorhamnose 3,5-epimerase family protein/NAD(P)-dependent oxidoreductase [Propionibacteriaceae bacterium]
MSAELSLETTAIPGLLVLHLPVHGDNRGWFKENWQRAKMTALGLPDFGPVQNNMSFNHAVGTTRGIHAEPWDKLVSSAHGRYFGVWVDLRQGPGFGTVVTTVVDESVAVFVPRGVGNAYQTLDPDVAYSYLVNAHWSEAKIPEYAYVNLADPTLAIPWPIPLDQAELSDKDKAHPLLADARRVEPRKTLILGAHGQLGRALAALFPAGVGADIDTLDLTDPAQVAAWPWGDFGVVLNAAAWTDVDGAETPEGRVGAWRANATVPATLARLALEHGFTLVHVSSDYVFDGGLSAAVTPGAGWTEDAPLAPLSVYGQSKAAGDLAVGVVPRHYLLRTSWVVGDGRNFLRTMAGLAERGVKPSVVSDQVGRLTHTANLAAAIKHLLDVGAPYGTYNCTDGGAPRSWADIARAVFAAHGRDPDDVTPVTTVAYYAGKDGIAPRPAWSVLDLAKLEATGYVAPEFPPGE